MDDDALLDIEQGRKFLNVGRTKFYQIIGAGEIAAVKIGKRTLVRRSALIQYIAGLPKYEKAGSVA